MEVILCSAFEYCISSGILQENKNNCIANNLNSVLHFPSSIRFIVPDYFTWK